MTNRMQLGFLLAGYILSLTGTASSETWPAKTKSSISANQVQITRARRLRTGGGLLYVALLFSLGCSIKHAVGINYNVPVQAATKIELIGCDRMSPPNCKQIRLTYAKGAEQLEAK